MNKTDIPNTIHAYIATLHLEIFGKHTHAYSMLVRSPESQSWHWGVKNQEHQWVDMEMFGLRRLLRAMTIQDPDRKFKVNAFMRGAYLEQRLGMAAKTKRDIDRGLETERLWNHDAWIETTTLWSMYRGGMREAISEEEVGYLAIADKNVRKEYLRIPSPLKTNEPYLESPEELILSL